MRGLLAAILFWPACAVAQAGFDVVVLREVHDNPAHHAEQARILTEIAPRAVVWEMITPEGAARLAGMDLADGAAVAEVLDWTARGWPDFAMYHAVMLAAPGAVHLGAEWGRADVLRAMEEGAAAVIGGGWGLGPLEPEDQAAREEEQAAAHCGALPAEMLAGMVEVQRLRDAGMARAAVEALEAHGGPVAVITGTGHARADVGVPAAIRAARPEVTVWALGQLEVEPGPGAPFDAVNVTAPVDRPDPCAVFD
jgi:uncharacterized iron-regulated protein